MNSKIYRCEWCGSTTDNKGNYIKDEARRKAEYIVNNFPQADKHTELVSGQCGGNSYEPDRVQVTHEMAMDAGMPEIEGTWINW